MRKKKLPNLQKRYKTLMDRYTYENPLNRIHGLLVVEDNPCKCLEDDSKISNIIICANPFGSKNGLKAIGSYLMMFFMIRAHINAFDKIILEVTNDEANIGDSSSEEDDSVLKKTKRKMMKTKMMKRIILVKYYF